MCDHNKMGKQVHFPSKFAPQKCCKRNNKGEDYICRLPDEILVIILSGLSMREAARTSFLSRRWRYLWTFFAGIFDFNGSEELYRFKWNENSLSFARIRFIGWVNQMLRSHQGPSVDGLKVCFDLDSRYKAAIDGWFEFAMMKEIRKLDVDLNNFSSFLPVQCELYDFPSHLLKNYALGLLTTLRLSFVSLTGEVLEYLLAHVPLLEVLSVKYSTGLVCFSVPGPSLKLKHLEIIECVNMENLEISAENLVSFTYDGPNIEILFKHVPRLIEVSFGQNIGLYAIKFLRQFSSYFMQLGRLSLFFAETKAPCFLDIPELGNLKYLELKISDYNRQSLLACIPLLDACPLLHGFMLKLGFRSFSTEGEATSFKRLMEDTTRKYKYLKVVELVGSVGFAAVEFITFVLENAASLEKLIVNPTKALSYYGHKYELANVPDGELGRVLAKKLAAALHPGAEFLIM